MHVEMLTIFPYKNTNKRLKNDWKFCCPKLIDWNQLKTEEQYQIV